MKNKILFLLDSNKPCKWLKTNERKMKITLFFSFWLVHNYELGTAPIPGTERWPGIRGRETRNQGDEK